MLEPKLAGAGTRAGRGGCGWRWRGEERCAGAGARWGRRAPGFKAWGVGGRLGRCVGGGAPARVRWREQRERGPPGAGAGKRNDSCSCAAPDRGRGQSHLCRSHRLSDEPSPRMRLVWK